MAKVDLAELFRQSVPLPPKGQRLEYFDTGLPGFGVRISHDGTRAWFYKYMTLTGKQRRLKLAAPVRGGIITVKDARKLAIEASAKVTQGADPSAERQAARKKEEIDAASLMPTVIEGFLASKHNNRHIHEMTRVFDRYILGKPGRDGKVYVSGNWTHLTIQSITRKDVAALLDEICGVGKDASRPSAGDRVLGHLGTLFGYAVSRGLIETSPISDRSVVKNLKRERVAKAKRVFETEEIAAVWRAANDMPYIYGPYFKLLLLTGQRRGEVARMQWQDLKLDALDGATWTVPPEKHKTGKNTGSEHKIPLTATAVTILRAIKPEDAEPEHYVFSGRGGDCPLSGFSKGKGALLKRMRDNHLADGGAPNAAPKGDWGLHDFRRTVRTRLSELEVSWEVAEAVIGHERKGLDKVYILSKLEKQKRAALETWEAHLFMIAAASNNVVLIKKQA